MDGLQPVVISPLTVAVLAGGTSAERSISLQSGAAVAAALAARGHKVRMVDPADVSIDDYPWAEVDMAFLALHGTFGEDGGVQRILERLGVAFTGSGSEASRLAFAKSAAKERFTQASVPTPEYSLIHETDSLERIDDLASRIGYPLVVKPDAQGSSIGVSIVTSLTGLHEAVDCCFCHDDFGLIERAIPGTEWTLGVIDEDPLPLIQITTPRGFYDFEAKYQDNATQYLLDQPLSAEQSRLITETGLAACRSLGTSGAARVDIRVDEQGRPWVLEVNTIPGMTDHSLVPKAAAKVGLDMGQLCELLIARALLLHATRRLKHAS